MTRVHTREVALTEAMPNAQIEFEAPLKLQNYFPQRKIEPPGPATARRHNRAPGLMYVLLTQPAPGEQPGGDDPSALPPENLPDPDSPQDNDDDDWYDEGMTADGFNGTKNGWAYSVGYRVRPGGITVELQARKGDLEGGSASGTHDLVPEYKAIENQREEIHKSITQAEQDIKEEEKGVTQTDQDFQQQMKQLLADQANRKDPNYAGPTLPRQVNKYGEPITDPAAQQLLKDQWQKKHDVEIQKLQAKEQILGEWRIKKDQLEARKRALKIAKGVAAQLFQIADDNFDARVRGKVDLDGFTISENLGFVNGDVDVAATHFRNLNGKVQAQMIGRLGKPGNEATKIPIMHVPVQFNVPIPVGGVPFVVQLGSDFLITLALSGMHASMTVEGQVAFKGDSGLTYAKGKANYDSSFSTSEDPQITNHQGNSPGVSAVVLAVQMPACGLGLGVFRRLLGHVHRRRERPHHDTGRCHRRRPNPALPADELQRDRSRRRRNQHRAAAVRGYLIGCRCTHDEERNLQHHQGETRSAREGLRDLKPVARRRCSPGRRASVGCAGAREFDASVAARPSKVALLSTGRVSPKPLALSRPTAMP